MLPLKFPHAGHKMLICVIWSSRTHAHNRQHVTRSRRGANALIRGCITHREVSCVLTRSGGAGERTRLHTRRWLHACMMMRRRRDAERASKRETRFQSNYLSICSHSTRTVRMEKELERARLCRRPLYAYTHSHHGTEEQANFKHATSSSTKFILLLNILKKSNTHTHTRSCN